MSYIWIGCKFKQARLSNTMISMLKYRQKAVFQQEGRCGCTFSAITGKAIAEYIRDMRLEHAAVLLPYANRIGILLDEDEAPKYSRGHGIYLPDGQSAGDYSPGGRVEVTYRGKPATICTIRAEQLVDIKLLP